MSSRSGQVCPTMAPSVSTTEDPSAQVRSSARNHTIQGPRFDPPCLILILWLDVGSHELLDPFLHWVDRFCTAIPDACPQPKRRTACNRRRLQPNTSPTQPESPSRVRPQAICTPTRSYPGMFHESLPVVAGRSRCRQAPERCSQPPGNHLLQIPIEMAAYLGLFSVETVATSLNLPFHCICYMHLAGSL